MQSFIEDLYYNKLETFENVSSTNMKNSKSNKKFMEIEKQFIKTLDENKKLLFDEYSILKATQGCEFELDRFSCDFKLGVRLSAENLF